jgi:hypothetical protein
MIGNYPRIILAGQLTCGLSPPFLCGALSSGDKVLSGLIANGGIDPHGFAAHACQGVTLRIGHYGHPSIRTGDGDRAGQKVRQPDRSHRQLAVPGMQGGEE